MPEKPDNPLADYEVLLCITGGIAAYKSADLASKFVQSGAGVSVAMTESARRFITPLTFQALTGRMVYTSLWDSQERCELHHVSLTERADLMIVAPVTANVIAKMAHGLADELVSTMALSACGSCEILIAPAMNARMWSAAATKANVSLLLQRGIHIIGPGEGYLACGVVGLGRMAEPDEILAAAKELLLKHSPKRKP